MTRTPIARRSAGIVLAALALGIVTTTAAARPIDPYPAAPVITQQSTGSNPAAGQDPGIAPGPHRAPSSKLAALNAARQQALANHVPPSGRYSTTDVSTYAPVKPTTANTPGNGFDWGDAGIGVAAGLALSAIAVAGVLTASRRREHETPRLVGAKPSKDRA
ncbi:MAG: hypothetical protein ACRDPA_21315 [Solirubrobacteraceae bacterium]